MKRFAVIGSNVENSFSPSYFKKKFADLHLDNTYKAISIPSLDSLYSIIESHQLDGFNVTIPYKEAIIPYLNLIDPTAAEINAVNTVKIENGKWTGYNTDCLGFIDVVTPFISSHFSALIFGSGGAAKAIQFSLNKFKIQNQIVSRSGALTYEDLTQHLVETNQLLINCTPLGMGNFINDAVDIPYSSISSNHVCFDVVYNPAETVFLKRCKDQGAQVINGLQMLENQADYSWKIWSAKNIVSCGFL